MKTSILYKNPLSLTGCTGDRLSSDGALERAAEYFCPDGERRRYFLQILALPLTEAEDIGYRREILRDFRRNPKLEPSLREWAEGFAELLHSHKNLRKETRREGEIDRDALAAINNLRISQAVCLKRCILFLRDAYGRLSEEYGSEGLNRLKEAFGRAALCPEAEETLKLCTEIENSDFRETDLRIVINDEGGVGQCEILYNPRDQLTEERKRFSLFKKEPPRPTSRTFEVLPRELLYVAAKKSTESLEQFCTELFSRFENLGKEISFYRTVLDYEAAMQDRGIALSDPEIGNATALTDLSDLLLLLSEGRKKVVPNNFTQKKGTLVFGKNSGGKTVFLRSLMAAQLLAQGGLPIPGKGTVKLYQRMDSVFAEGERDLRTDRAGRFEQEVRQMASLLEEEPKNALFFFNEPFQTTDPGEGAEGLAGILRHLTALGTDWIAVTHLKELQDLFSDDGADLLTAEEGYKILPQKGRI